jgi:hypothetical protein
MKSLLLALFFLPAISMAQVAFDCPAQASQIARENETIVVIQADGGKITNDRIYLPAGQSTDEYQTRYGTYYELMTIAHTSMPYMPEALMLVHMSRSQKLYKRGFKVFEGESNEVVGLSKLYCDMFIKAIKNY